MSYQPPYQNNGGTGNTQPQIGSFGPPQGAGNQGGNPNMGYQPPQPGYGAPSGPPGNAGYGSPSTAYGQPGQSYSNMNQGPSNYNSGPPPPGGLGSMPPTGGPPNMGGPPGPGLVQPPPNRAAFFSTASGAPIPSGPTMGGPPSSTGGGPGPPSYGGMPPTGSMGGPPMSGPAGANNPATFYSPANPVGGPPGAQGDYNSPQQYGAPSSTHGMPSAFGANNDMQNQRQQPPGGNAFGGGQSWGGGNGNANSQKEHNNFPEQGNFPNSLPLVADMDLSITCNPAFIQSTVTKLVVSSAAATASKIPLGFVVKPMAGDKGTGNDLIDVVDFGSTGVIRCKRCRTYIHPYVTWSENGRRWKCTICGMLNDVPSAYFSHLDANGQRRDRDQRWCIVM